MQGKIDIWLFIAGLGLFLFGMLQLEESLKALAGKEAKLFLKKHTTNKFKGLLSGTLVTALLQSSSVVTLMLLAFVGAELITLRNAISIILGSNLGTTFTGWIVATFGFKINIEAFTMPAIGVGAFLMLFFTNYKKLKEYGKLLVGFGLLFLGLAYMKDGVEVLANELDLSAFSNYAPIIFLFIALIFTAIVQSSSLTIVIVLSALNAGVIGLTSAFAMVIGADVGTTITVWIGFIKGVQSKKMVAYSHIIINLVSGATAFALLFPFQYLIVDIFQVKDNLIATVLFHSLFNFLGIIIMLPFVNKLATYFEKQLKNSNKDVSMYLSKVTTGVPDAAIEALQKEIENLIKNVLVLNLKAFRVAYFDENATKHLPFEFINLLRRRSDFATDYIRVKELEGEIIAYYTLLEKERLSEEESKKLNQIIYSVQNVMHASKDIKDIEHNLRDFEKSINPFIGKELVKFHKQLLMLYSKLYEVLIQENRTTAFEDLINLMNENNKDYHHFNEKLFASIKPDNLSDLEISTLINVNKEIHSSNKALIRALKDYVLTPEYAHQFDLIPETHLYI